MTITERLRRAAAEVRRKSYPLSDLIPLMQEAVDCIERLEQHGPSMPRGTDGDGLTWEGTMRECLQDARDAAEAEAKEVDRLNALIRAEKERGEVVVTWDENKTRILAVTRQDDEGRILSVIAEVRETMCGRCYDEGVEVFPANCAEKPEALLGAPLGQYHCPDCGAMVMAGVPHPPMCKHCIERKHPGLDAPAPEGAE